MHTTLTFILHSLRISQAKSQYFTSFFIFIFFYGYSQVYIYSTPPQQVGYNISLIWFERSIEGLNSEFPFSLLQKKNKFDIASIFVWDWFFSTIFFYIIKFGSVWFGFFV